MDGHAIDDQLISDQMLNSYTSIVAQLAASAEGLTDIDGTFIETIFQK